LKAFEFRYPNEEKRVRFCRARFLQCGILISPGRAGRSNPCSAVTRYRLPFIIGARLFLFVADRSLPAAKRFGTRESRNVFVAFGGVGAMLTAALVLNESF